MLPSPDAGSVRNRGAVAMSRLPTPPNYPAVARAAPGFAERLLARVTRIFDRLAPDTVLQRRNWSVVPSDALHLPHAAPVRARAAEIRPEQAGEALHLRVERQTLRRLPATGGLLFSIRVWLHPLNALPRDRRAAFGNAWRSASPAFRAYKGLPVLDRAVDAWLAGGDHASEPTK